MNGNEIEALIKHIARKVYLEYPDCEMDDLIGQGWLIVCEKISGWDKRRASQRTYLHHKVYGGLRDYVRRILLKEQNLNGMRDHGEYHEPEVAGPEDMVVAKMEIEHILKGEEGVSRDVLELMLQGYTQSEASRELGIPTSTVGDIIKKIREKHEEVK